MRLVFMLFLVVQVLSEDGMITMITGKKGYKIHERQKRQLLYPKQTLLQVSFAVTHPVGLKFYNIYVSNGFQLNFVCPWLPNQLPNSFLWKPPVITARSVEKRSLKYEEENSMIIKEDPFKDLSTTQLYHLLGSLLQNYGFNGTECVKHSICQLASIPLHRDDDVLHEILHFVLTPSEHHDTITVDLKEDNFVISPNSTFPSEPTIFEYLEAEMHGRNNEDCDILYYHCHRSPLDEITQIHMGDVFT